ncbi:TrmH family RNA methyltransferase [Chryseolinea lacunae]|uniref:RNA methyltransferase n=1 Tax=Chryseolinea lacunae TaxID=2801331 RepID=A0ABS1KXY0_9BACT|nr:RNA methyltransferase [Chryseolinea lacunae]MBL0743557.1 RNA methyltransferase [Chryseolinea lacunae]
MLSKAKIKFVKSLQIKKYRKQEQCFLVEGAKSVQELLASDFEVTMLVATAEFLSGRRVAPGIEVVEVKPAELEGLGEFQTNYTALAVARHKPNIPIHVTASEFALVLDDLRDPGNLGTIVRTADWYGITKVIASQETADFYSPKVISSTMGSFTRVSVYYTDLAPYLTAQSLNVFGAYLDGQDVHRVDFGTGGLIVIGNESKGISPALEQFITHKVTIPRYGHAESLNASIATAVICDNLRR